MHTSPPLFSSLALSLSLFLSVLHRKMVGGGVCLDRKRVNSYSCQLLWYDTFTTSSLLPPTSLSLLSLYTPHTPPTPPSSITSPFFSLTSSSLSLSSPPHTHTHTHTQTHSLACQSVTAESWVLELARNQRMNTDVRRNIFCVLVTSEASGNNQWDTVEPLAIGHSE